jgi:hypothetical protein
LFKVDVYEGEFTLTTPAGDSLVLGAQSEFTCDPSTSGACASAGPTAIEGAPPPFTDLDTLVGQLEKGR